MSDSPTTHDLAHALTRFLVGDAAESGFTLGANTHWIDDPDLLGPDGRALETWREGFAHPDLMPRDEYERSKRLLQIELLKAQNWVIETGQRVVVIFEGRDAAGKGGTIKRFMEHLNPRGARVCCPRGSEPRRSRPVVLPALCGPATHPRRDRPF
jgi:hypothetical protein